MLLKVNFLGHEFGYNTMKPIHSKIAAFHKIPSPTGKVALMSFIGALIVPQEYLIQFEDFLLSCNIPTTIVKPLTVIKPLNFSPLNLITLLFQNNYIPITNCSSFLLKSFP